MNFSEYQKLSERTLNPSCGPDDDNYILGLIGETGELTDIIKKFVWHKHPLDLSKLTLELGDILFYVAAIATMNRIALETPRILCDPADLEPGLLCRALAFHVVMVDHAITEFPAKLRSKLELVIQTVGRIAKRFDIDLDVIMDANITKLYERYPVAFSPEASINRAA